MPIQLSYAPSLTDSLRPIEFDDIEGLARWLNDQPAVSNKTDSAIIVAATFDTYPISAKERTLDRATTTSAAFLDFDDGSVTPEEVAQELEDAGLQFIIRPTFSSTPEAPRFCAIVPYDQACPADKHRAAIDRVLRPKLNGHASFASESLVPVQPRFVSLKSGVRADILLPEGFSVPLSFDPDTLPAIAATSAQAADPLALVSLDPAERLLFRLSLNYIDADTLPGRHWVAVLGCGMRMFGITPELLRTKELSTEQWGLIADLEAFCARGSKDKYRNPQNGIGIDRCTVTRLNGDGDWVPSLVMQVASDCLYGTTMITLTGIIKRTDFFALDCELQTDFPELVEQARQRFHHDVVEEAPLPTEEELQAATLDGERRIAKFNEENADYFERVDTLLDRMPKGAAQRLAHTLATGGVPGRATWFLQPPAAVVLAAMIINVVMANRVWLKMANLPALAGNLYAYMFADSGTGKSVMVDYAMEILAKAGYEWARYDGKVHSASAMHTNLMSRGPTLLLTADELKMWFSNVERNAQPNSNQATLDAFMLNVWLASSRGRKVTPDVRAADRQGERVNVAPPIKQPNISTFMIGVPEDMHFFSDGMLSDGSLARSLCFVPTENTAGETDDQRTRRHAKRRDEMRTGTGEVLDDKEKDIAVAALIAFDKALQDQGLGESRESNLTARDFVEEQDAPALRDEMVAFRDFSMARSNLPDNMVRILYCDTETLKLIGKFDLEFSLRFPSRKVESIMNRYAEKAERLALVLTMFDNPAATKIDYNHMEFALNLVALSEEPWLKRILDAKQEITLSGNKFEKFLPEIQKLLEKGGPLHAKPAGFSLLDIRRDKRFAPLQSVLSKLKVASEAIRRDAQTTLDALNLSPIKNPNGKGERVFHPDHRPELHDEH